MKISLVMIVKNEEHNLPTCLNSVKDIVDEIIIVDTGSTDSTKEIAKSFGAAIFDFKWNNNFAAARNFGLKKSSGDWNLILDADESISLGNREDILQFAQQNPNCIGKIRIKSPYYEDNILTYSQDEISRLAPKGVMYTGKIHEQLDVKYPRQNVNLEIYHTGYLNTDKSERNLNLILKELKNNPNNNYMLYQAAKTYFVAKEYKKADYYFKKSYKTVKKDAGYIKSLIVSYLYNLTNLPNIEEGLKIIEKECAVFNNDADFCFVSGVYYLNLVLFNTNKYIEYIDKIEESYLKCLEIGENTNNTVVGVGSFKALYNLGTLYEVFNLKDKAIEYYNLSAEYGFEPAKERLATLNKN